MKRIFVFSAFFVLFISLKAQISVNTTVNATTLVNSIAGQGVIITNPVLNCPNGAYATFTGGAGNMGLASGILLTTGYASTAVGPNNGIQTGEGFCHGTTTNDPQLNSIEPKADWDLCVLEFDIKPQCDMLSLRYVFGSEEYPEFVGQSFNDAFGFFLSGPNPGGGNYTNTNIALLPSTSTVVSIDNVNSATNPSYYVDNIGGPNVQYDGLTTVLTATMPVVQCSTYHMKFAIADAGDCNVDSGVFFDFKGLNCPNSDAQLNAVVSQAVEACKNATFQIIADFAVATTVNITTTGTATNGVDFTTPASYNLPAGSSTTNATLTAVADGLTEGVESVNIILSYNVCGTLVYDTLPLTINDSPIINFTSTPESCGACNGSASATFTNAALPITTMTWSPAPGGGQGTANATGLCDGDYILSIVDNNGCPATDTVTIGTSCPTCSMTALTATPGACNSGTNTFTLNGNITFTNAPASGTLTVTNSCGGTQVFNAPFTSPQAYTIN
ncbi:MAG: choice-of-anchor L domain-containing protein, partial [Flavobacteriales bacterium]|nr:choice-of-anchor L domain-containing protein [Flavobacteriales bacterium]